MKIKFTKTQTVEKINNIPAKKRKWDRWIYLGVLILITLSFLKWLLTPMVFDIAHGVLLQEQHPIQFTGDIRIVEYKFEEGNEVKKGDTLFVFHEDITTINSQGAKIDSVNILIDYNQGKANLIAIDAQIAKRKLFLVDLNKRLEYWKSELDRKEKLVYLNAITPNELANVDRSIDDVSHQINTTETEYRVLQTERAKLLASLNSIKSLRDSEVAYRSENQFYIVPYDGKIDRINIPQNQICYKEQIVTSIIKDNYFVRAYIEMSDLDEFNENDDVIIELPYTNKKLSGKVKRMYNLSEIKDEVILDQSVNKYKNAAVVEIVPSEGAKWDNIKISRIPVKVKKGKIGI